MSWGPACSTGVTVDQARSIRPAPRTLSSTSAQLWSLRPRCSLTSVHVSIPPDARVIQVVRPASHQLFSVPKFNLISVLVTHVSRDIFTSR